jgi:hypothetical protein
MIVRFTREEDDMEKKQWQKPQLLVLVRSNPEESLNNYCKHDSPFSGPTLFYPGCYLNFTGGGCMSCNVFYAS